MIRMSSCNNFSFPKQHKERKFHQEEPFLSWKFWIHFSPPLQVNDHMSHRRDFISGFSTALKLAKTLQHARQADSFRPIHMIYCRLRLAIWIDSFCKWISLSWPLPLLSVCMRRPLSLALVSDIYGHSRHYASLSRQIRLYDPHYRWTELHLNDRCLGWIEFMKLGKYGFVKQFFDATSWNLYSKVTITTLVTNYVQENIFFLTVGIIYFYHWLFQNLH